jgi:hypothetical protein
MYLINASEIYNFKTNKKLDISLNKLCDLLCTFLVKISNVYQYKNIWHYDLEIINICFLHDDNDMYCKFEHYLTSAIGRIISNA